MGTRLVEVMRKELVMVDSLIDLASFICTHHGCTKDLDLGDLTIELVKVVQSFKGPRILKFPGVTNDH